MNKNKIITDGCIVGERPDPVDFQLFVCDGIDTEGSYTIGNPCTMSAEVYPVTMYGQPCYFTGLTLNHPGWTINENGTAYCPKCS